MWHVIKRFVFLSCCASPRLNSAFHFTSTRRIQGDWSLKHVSNRDHGLWDRKATKQSSLHSIDRERSRPAGVVDEHRESNTSQQLIGTLVLLTVPLSWGTYVPVVRYLYAIQPPVPGFVFSACYYALAAATTTSLAILQSRSSDAPRALHREGLRNSQQSFLPLTAGIELGLYLFVANCLQVVALRTVESDRAGFLVQLTTVMVPLAEALLARSLSSIPGRTWMACIAAFGGFFIMNLDGKDDINFVEEPIPSLLGTISSFSHGDFLIMGAAVLYTLHVVRLGSYARKTTPMVLAASKATAESIYSFLLIAVVVSLSHLFSGDPGAMDYDGLLFFTIETGREIVAFFDSFGAGVDDGSISSSTLVPAFCAVLWTGWITCGYTVWAQSFGQSRIR
jgi:drug/metabolite transporter (DMT)-like permease